MYSKRDKIAVFLIASVQILLILFIFYFIWELVWVEFPGPRVFLRVFLHDLTDREAEGIAGLFLCFLWPLMALSFLRNYYTQKKNILSFTHEKETYPTRLSAYTWAALLGLLSLSFNLFLKERGYPYLEKFIYHTAGFLFAYASGSYIFSVLRKLTIETIKRYRQGEIPHLKIEKKKVNNLRINFILIFLAELVFWGLVVSHPVAGTSFFLYLSVAYAIAYWNLTGKFLPNIERKITQDPDWQNDRSKNKGQE